MILISLAILYIFLACLSWRGITEIHWLGQSYKLIAVDV